MTLKDASMATVYVCFTSSTLRGYFPSIVHAYFDILCQKSHFFVCDDHNANRVKDFLNGIQRRK